MSELLVPRAHTDNEAIVGSLKDVPIKEDESLRMMICSLEGGMEGHDDEIDADSLPLMHHFAPGVYGREIFLQKGIAVVGKLHKHSHLNVIAKGKVIVTTEAGREELEAPCIWTSYANTKRAVFALEDTIWMTIHPTDTDDLDKIEEFTIAKNYTELGLMQPEFAIEGE